MIEGLKQSEEVIAKLLDKLLDAAITGDFKMVKKLAKDIHKRAQKDKMSIVD
jgi:hypothetical protein